MTRKSREPDRHRVAEVVPRPYGIGLGYPTDGMRFLAPAEAYATDNYWKVQVTLVPVWMRWMVSPRMFATESWVIISG
jgi:hypothetical protein